jgi:hypothetical protein
MTIKQPATKEIILHPKQFEAFDFSTQFCAAIAGVRGGKCVSSDTIISGRRIDSFGFEKQSDQLYNLGGLLRVSARHRVLTPKGWTSVGDLVEQGVSHFFAFVQIQHRSNEEFSLSSFLAGDVSSWKTISDFQSGYLDYFHSHGGQPQTLKESGQDGVPLPVGVRACKLAEQYEQEHSHLCQSFGHPSNMGDVCPARRLYDVADPDAGHSGGHNLLRIREYDLSLYSEVLRAKVRRAIRGLDVLNSYVYLILFPNNVWTVAVPCNLTIKKDKIEAIWDTSIPFTHAYEAGGLISHNTYVGSAWAAHKIATMAGNGIITGPDYKTLQQATLATFFQLFPQYRKFYKEQKSVIEFPDKQIFIRSVDDPLSPEGITADWIWADEAGKYKQLAWTVLRSRVSMAKGQIFLTTTPYNMGWLYQDFYKPWQDKTDPDYTVVSWASVDNPYFPKEVYEAEKRRLPAVEFKRRYEGAFSRMQGLVYDLQSFHLIEAEEAAKIRPDIVLGGIDWGWANPAALIVIILSQGIYYLVDEWYEIGKTTGQIIDTAIKLQNKWKINRWYADAANPEKIAEANINTGLYVLPYEKKKDSITAGTLAIGNLIMDNRLRVVRGLRNTLSEFETYQYPEPDDAGLIKKDQPMPFYNHLLDGMRYAIMGYQPALRAKVPEPGTYTEISIRRMLGGRPGGKGISDDLI